MTLLIINGCYAHTANTDTQTDIKFQLLGNQQREWRAWGAQTIQGSTLMFTFPLNAQTIQGRKLFKGVYYSRKYGALIKFAIGTIHILCKHVLGL